MTDPFVAREWSAPATDSADIGWDRRPNLGTLHRCPRHQAPRPPRPRGPASLADLAARVAAANIHNIGPSDLRDLSTRAVQAVLEYLDPKSLSLSAWKALQELARAGRVEANTLALPHFHPHFHRYIETPTADLSVYLKPLHSHDFAFISHLRFAGSCLIKAQDILHLPQFCKNLGFLEFFEPSDETLPFPRLSDRLFKAWSLDKDPFPKLRGIRIVTRHSVTEQSLQYLTELPALIMLEVRARKAGWAHSGSLATGLGWVYCNWKIRSLENRVFRPQYQDLAQAQDLALPVSHEFWLQLSQAVALSLGPSTRAGGQIYEDDLSNGLGIYNLLEMPTLRMLQERRPPLTASPLDSSALASLTLGQARRNLYGGPSRHPPPSEHMFFWRYWQGSVRYPVPQKQDASRKTSLAMERPDLTTTAPARLRKRRRVGTPGEGTFYFPVG